MTGTTIRFCPGIRRRARFLGPALLPAAAILLSACLPERADFDLGVSTAAIVGQIEVQGEAVPPQDVLIVVYQTHYLFSTRDDAERIYRTSATLAGIGTDGRYAVPMPSDVVRVDLLFVAPDRLSDQFRFSRQVGIGQVTYRAVLREDVNWRAHFYTFLQPSLSHLIVEPRYQLSLDQQQRLGDWLHTQAERLESGAEQRRRRRAAERDAPPAAGEHPLAPAIPPAYTPGPMD